MITPICFRCRKPPADLEEYTSRFTEEREFWVSVNDLVIRDEGTYNHETNTFACTQCYIDIGMPTAPPPGWKAPATLDEDVTQ